VYCQRVALPIRDLYSSRRYLTC